MDLLAFLQYVERGEIPPAPPNYHHLTGEMLYSPEYRKGREFYIERGMWAIVDERWTRDLAGWIGDRKVLEIMAGAGWLAKALHAHGVEVVATDADPSWDGRHSRVKLVHPIEIADATSAIAAHPEAEVLIVSWPPYGESDVVDACKVWGDRGPIVYIGEDMGGCNAPDEFFDYFIPDETAISVGMASWGGIHDYVTIGYWRAE